MKKNMLMYLGLAFAFASNAIAQDALTPIIDTTVVFEEKNGMAVVEAEFFYKQSKNETHGWYLNSPVHQPSVWPDFDAASYTDAGNLAYIEALPDVFYTLDDPIIPGENLGTVAGSVAVVHYKVYFSHPGRYYIWSRIRSNDGEDNTMHGGINGTWPKTATILQFPKEKKMWIWKNEIRIKVVPPAGHNFRAVIDVPTKGIHDIQFSLREDGHEFDRFILTSDSTFKAPDGVGPAVTIRKGKLPKPFTLTAQKSPSPLTLHNPDGSLYGANVMYEETEGKVAFEAENFYRQTKTDKRMWHLVSNPQLPTIGPDSDPKHLEGASKQAYLELLPDARQKDEDKINSSSSIAGTPGKAAIISYQVHFNTPGKYYLWVRGYATDGDDNTLHAGVDTLWPASGQKIHLNKMNAWTWICNQRDTKNKIYLDIPTAGRHEIKLSMREDGCEIDQIFLCTDEAYIPSDQTELPSKIRKGKLEPWYEIREKRMAAAAKYLSKDGSIIIEAESAPASEGWAYKADESGHTGFGYYEWTAKGQGIAAGKGILNYTFEVTEAGNYQLLLHNRMKDATNRPDTPDPDGNDVWVRLTGGKDVDGQQKLGTDWVKVAILGHLEGWTWNTNADPGKPHPITPVCRYFEPGTYTIELSGRSEGYAIDRLVWLKYKKAPLKEFAEQEMVRIKEGTETRTYKP